MKLRDIAISLALSALYSLTERTCHRLVDRAAERLDGRACGSDAPHAIHLDDPPTRKTRCTRCGQRPMTIRYCQRGQCKRDGDDHLHADCWACSAKHVGPHRFTKRLAKAEKKGAA